MGLLKGGGKARAYLLLGVIVNVPGPPIFIIVLVLVVVLIFIILEFVPFHIITQFFVLKSLAGKPVNCTRDELLLDIFSQLVVKFKSLFDIRRDSLVVVRRGLRRGEEIEKGFCRHGYLDDPSLLRI